MEIKKEKGYKDYLIYVSIIEWIKNDNINEEVYFVTDNTSDFCDDNSREWSKTFHKDFDTPTFLKICADFKTLVQEKVKVNFTDIGNGGINAQEYIHNLLKYIRCQFSSELYGGEIAVTPKIINVELLNVEKLLIDLREIDGVDTKYINGELIIISTIDIEFDNMDYLLMCSGLKEKINELVKLKGIIIDIESLEISKYKISKMILKTKIRFSHLFDENDEFEDAYDFTNGWIDVEGVIL